MQIVTICSAIKYPHYTFKNPVKQFNTLQINFSKKFFCLDIWFAYGNQSNKATYNLYNSKQPNFKMKLFFMRGEMQESNRLVSNLYFYKMKDYLEVAGRFIKITEWIRNQELVDSLNGFFSGAKLNSEATVKIGYFKCFC